MENNVVLEFITNISTSAYFALGVVSVTIVIYILVIAPLMNHVKQLDDVIMDKLSLLPTTDTYATLFSIITDQNVFNEGLLKEYEEIRDAVLKLNEIISGINGDQDKLRENMGIFIEQMNNLEMTLEDYASHLEFSTEKTSKQMNSLVNAKIDTTTFLIKLIDSLKTTKHIDQAFNGEGLYELRENLKVGVEIIKNMNYKSKQPNPRSGSVDKLTDSEY